MAGVVRAPVAINNHCIFCAGAPWTHSAGNPHAEGTFTRTLMNVATFAGTLVKVREVLVNRALWVRQSTQNFAQASPKFA